MITSGAASDAASAQMNLVRRRVARSARGRRHLDGRGDGHRDAGRDDRLRGFDGVQLAAACGLERKRLTRATLIRQTSTTRAGSRARTSSQLHQSSSCVGIGDRCQRQLIGRGARPGSRASRRSPSGRERSAPAPRSAGGFHSSRMMVRSLTRSRKKRRPPAQIIASLPSASILMQEKCRPTLAEDVIERRHRDALIDGMLMPFVEQLVRQRRER